MHSVQSTFLLALCILLCAVPAGAVLIMGSADTYIDSQNPNTAYGGSLTMHITPNSSGLLRFVSVNSALPTGTTSSQIAKANLQIWVTAETLNNTGSLEVYELTSPFVANTVTYNTRPTTASSPATVVSAAALSRYLEIDITSLVKKWVANSGTNNGIEIRPSSSSTFTDMLIGTKWNTAGSQPPILDITLTGPVGATGPQGPAGPLGPQGPQGSAAATMYTICASNSLSELSCSCPIVHSQVRVTAVGCQTNGFCTANIPGNPCSTSAVSGTQHCGTIYYGICCVCSN